MIQSSWIPLGEVIARRNGSVDPSKFPDEVFELLSIPAFDAGRPEIVPGRDIGSSKQVVQSGDVLLSKIVPHIRRAWVVSPTTSHRLIASGEWIVFRDERFLPGYLKHLLTCDGFHRQFMQTVSGVGGSLLRARPAEVAKIRVSVPSKVEQQRIATILDKADSLRRKRQQAICLANEFLRALFLDMFGDLTVNPHAWPEVSLGDVIQEGPRNGLYCPSEVYGSGVPILRIDGFYYGEIVNGYQFKRVQIDESTKARFSLMDDSVVLNRVNSREFVGKAAHVFNLEEPTVFESNMMNFSVDRNRIDTYFLVQQLQSAFIRNQIARARKDAVNQSSINQEDVKGLRVLVPPISAQKRFRKIADGQMQLRSRLEQSNKALVSMRASLSFALLGEYSSL